MSLIKQNEAIHCKTQEELKRVFAILTKNGECMASGRVLTPEFAIDLFNNNYENNTVIMSDNVDLGYGGNLGYADLEYAMNGYYGITPASEFLARNGVEVKSIEDKIREVLERHIYDNDGINLAIPELTELFSTHS